VLPLQDSFKKLLYTLKLDPKTEIYPKQTNVEGRSGNFIKHSLFWKKRREVAINPQTGEEFTFEQYIRVVEAIEKQKKN
jgi:hypothetical protein